MGEAKLKNDTANTTEKKVPAKTVTAMKLAGSARRY